MMMMPESVPEEVPRAVSRALKRSRPLGRLAQLLGLSILRGDIPPGEPVTLEALPTCDLDASRTQFREAVKVLEGKGLIESKPRSGTRVRPRHLWNLCDPEILSWRIATAPADHVLIDFHQLRRAIEPEAAALAARQPSGADRGRLAAAFADMTAADAGQRHRDDLVDAGVRFHQLLLAASGNELFSSLSRVLEPPYVLSLSLSVAVHPAPERCVALYKRLLDAVLARKPDDARRRAALLLGDAEEVLTRFMGIAEPERVQDAASARALAAS